ncbi:hypothetical protein GCG54_00007385 [Colletotrichum gloeosporioides]|uniref:Uncharacterized protein n=1 Tax=Colletotrichum gloeosporioides TaxID=474922 RepID=A0A8H4CPS3_COLGL|nr:uncharacterized protein GCG54_00007385 [Colletotrichum gloeosporioides]KAF3807652.1 hypothetical protein GCG54_00007385 [Colletotrichum gloeosporioides]
MSIPAVVIDEDYANASRRQERSHPENMIHRDAVKSHTENENSDRLRKLKSPASNRSLKRENDDLPPGRRRTCAPTNTRNARTSEDDTEQDPTAKAGKLWRPDEEPLKRTDDAESSQPTRSSRTFEPRSPEMDQTEVPIKQPETRPITQEQLVAEVKGIYAGLVMVESKCIEVDNAQSSTIETGPKLNNEQWQALIALHRTLLHEHNDFFLSQSSSAPKKSQFSSGVTDYIVEGSVNGIGIEASPDTGSDECIVSSDFASKLGQSTVPGTEKMMTLANGKKVWSPGMIEVLWRFANDQTPHILKCWILPNSSKDFVLGSRFLKMTGALTKFFRHA